MVANQMTLKQEDYLGPTQLQESLTVEREANAEWQGP